MRRRCQIQRLSAPDRKYEQSGAQFSQSPILSLPVRKNAAKMQVFIMMCRSTFNLRNFFF